MESSNTCSDKNGRTVSVYGPFYIGNNCLQIPLAADKRTPTKENETVKISLDVSKYRIPTPKVGERRSHADHRTNSKHRDASTNGTDRNRPRGTSAMGRKPVLENISLKRSQDIQEQECIKEDHTDDESAQFQILQRKADSVSELSSSTGLKLLKQNNEDDTKAGPNDWTQGKQRNVMDSVTKSNRLRDITFKISSTEDNYVLNKYKSRVSRPCESDENGKRYNTTDILGKAEATPPNTCKKSQSPGKAYFSKHRLKIAKLKRKFFESLPNKDSLHFSKPNTSGMNSSCHEDGANNQENGDSNVNVQDSPNLSEKFERVMRESDMENGNKRDDGCATESKATMLRKLGLSANDRYKRYSSAGILGDMSVFSAGHLGSDSRVKGSEYLAVVAIDLGTTYSGYAYSFMHDPEPVHLMRSQEGGHPGVFDQKVPTAILLDPEGEFHSFGYAARDFYHDLDLMEAPKWMFFDRFKMLLHNEENLTKDTKLTSISGRETSALNVFSYSLAHFKNLVTQELSDQSALSITSDVIRWVITVPAIWKASAKQFMRQAAYEAGIVPRNRPEQLLIALEPEAASIYCRRLRMLHLTSDDTRTSVSSLKTRSSLSLPDLQNESLNIKSDDLVPGTRYMVVDCGGGTVDITVHELLEGGRLQELHRASGGSHGSVGIDEEFENLLCAIFGEDIVEQFKLRRPSGWLDLLAVFESRKRTASPYRSSSISLSLPFSFIGFYKKCRGSSIESAVRRYGDPDISWTSDGMLRLAPGTMRRLFLSTVDGIKRAIGNVLNSQALRDLDYLFLVGGFAESSMVQHEIRKDFGGLLKVVIPPGVSMSILKGAVYFGLDPDIVEARCSRMTYGVGVLHRFDPEKHPKEKRVSKDGTDWCTDIFDAFVRVNQSVALGESIIRRYTPVRRDQSVTVIHIYSTENDDVEFVTDAGVTRCGTLTLTLCENNIKSVSYVKREIRTVMMFGDTEIKVRATDVTSDLSVEASIDFMSL